MERKLGESSLFFSRSLHWLMLSNKRYVSPTVNRFVKHLAIRFLEAGPICKRLAEAALGSVVGVVAGDAFGVDDVATNGGPGCFCGK